MTAEKWMYVLIVVVSIAAGALIAGGPSSFRSRDASAPASASLLTATSTTTAPTSATVAVVSTTTSTTVATSDVVSSSTTEPAMATTTAPEPSGPRARDELVVAVANGSGYPGLAGRTAAELAGLGYTQPDAIDSARIPTSGVYAAGGLEDEATELALDAGLAASAVMPMDSVPSLSVPNTFDLVLVLGADAVPADG